MTTNPLDAIQARADAATGPLCGTEGQPMNWPGKSGGCWSCDARIAETLEFLDSLSRPFIVCPQCGNKRCPKATWHGNQCSGSNTSGQSAPNPDAVFIAHAREDAPKLVAALRAVEAAHQKAPVYDTWASDCGHDDCDSVEAADGETYCPRSVAAYTCEHCADLSRDNMNGELPDWPCPTIGAIREALNG